MLVSKRLAVLACAVAGTGILVDRSLGQGIGPHLGGGVLAGDAAGLDDGYVHFGGFIPLTQPNERVLFFTDGNLQLYNEGSDSFGGNVGLGVRSLNASGSAILGANLYVDRRDLGLAEFNQIGVGLESLGEQIDVRMNLSLPIGPATRDFTRGTGFMGTGIGRAYDRFAAFRSLDIEAGALLYDRNAEQLRAFVAGYSLFHDTVEDTAGVRGRLEARFADQVFLGGFVEHDGEFGTTGGVTLDFRFGRGGSPSEDSSQHLLARLGDPVQRRRHLMIARREQAEYFTMGANQLQIEHVSDLSPISTVGEGGLTVSSLEQAATSAADIVYITGGVYEGRSIVVAKDGQQLLSGSMDHTIQTDQGTVFLPASGEVVLRNSPGDAILIAADNVAVIGFTIENPGQDGISAALAPTGAGIVLADNHITGAGRHGIHFADQAVGELRNNHVSGSRNHGILLAGFQGDLRGNVVRGSRRLGISVEGDLLGEFVGNTMEENALGGLSIDGDLDGDLLANVANDSRLGAGIAVGGSVTGRVVGNFADDNAGHTGAGISIGGAIGGDLRDNGAFGNSQEGVLVGGDVGGDVRANDLYANGSGLTINGGVSGDVAENTFLENQGHGLRVEGTVGGDVTRNEANNNADGMLLHGVVAGEVVDNVALENDRYAGNNPIIYPLYWDINYSLSAYYSGVGIQVDGEGVVFRNNVTNGNGSGAVLTNAALVEGNQAINNYGDGISVSGTSAGSIVDNLVTGNGGSGLRVSGTVEGIVSRNTANENDYGIYLRNGNTEGVIDNTANNNRYGIYTVGDTVGDLRENEVLGNQARGIHLSGDLSGDLSRNVVSHTEWGPGLWINGAINGDLANNVLTENGGDGLYLAHGSIDGDLIGNTVTGNAGHGIEFRNGSLGGDLTNNVLTENGDDGLHVYGSIGGDLTGNNATGNSGDGIEFRNGSLGGSLTNNLLTENGNDGLYVYGSIGGDLMDNTATGNGGDGFDIRQRYYDTGTVGRVVKNTASDNGGDGISIRGRASYRYTYSYDYRYGYRRRISILHEDYGETTGDLAANTTVGNGGHGIEVVGAVAGGVTNNTANDNGLDGVFVNGSVRGDVSGNTLLNNRDDGLEVNGTVGGAVTNNTWYGNVGVNYEQ